MLPVSASFKLDPGVLSGGGKCEKSVLQGLPGDKVAALKTSELSVGNELADVLAPYSFSVYKFYK
jgi:hypothetical protein